MRISRRAERIEPFYVMEVAKAAGALAREVAVKWPGISIVVASGRIVPLDGQMPDGAHFIGKPFSAEVVHGHLQEILPDDGKPEPLQWRL